MRFTRWSIAAAIVPLAAAAPPFVFQDGKVAPPPSQPILKDLSVDDFHAVQDALAKSAESVVDGTRRLVTDAFNLIKEEIDIVEEEVVNYAGPPHKHPLPPPFIDFSEYTILEIVNASFTGHHHDDKEYSGFGRKLKRGAFPGQFDDNESEGHHKPDPKHLPLHRLAGLLNFAPEAAELLEKDDITLLAPDDWALAPPHKRGEHHGPHFVPDGRSFTPLEQDQEELAPVASVPHPFHAKELSPKRLNKLAAASLGDDDEEKKKEFFRKVVKYIGEYHIVPQVEYPHKLADHSTIPSLHADSRIRVAPALDRFPFPHPTLRFNHYAWKRGPVIKAKNGLIYFISHPLLPPLTPLNQLFLTPQFFSGFTNALQKVDLDKPLLPELPHASEHDSLDTNPLFSGVINELVEEHKLKEFTVFTPTNDVFKKLPFEAVAFFHSPIPFAKKVLKYVLGYHIVPVTFFSDYFHDGSAAAEYVVKREVDVEVPIELLVDGPHDPPHAPEHPPHQKVNVTHYVLPTLLTHFSPNATIKAAVFEYRLFGFGPQRRSIVVFPSLPPKKHDDHHEDDAFSFFRQTEGSTEHDHHHRPHFVRVAFPDVPARAGAIHVLGDQVLLPPPPPHHEDEHKHEDQLDRATRLAVKEAKKLRKTIVRLFA
ncbi:hypothetical protein JCM11641_001158 [Rhodosporidiobolus odoratus]